MSLISTTQCCLVCGAANEQVSTQCVACGHLLVHLSKEQKASKSVLLHERYHLEKILGSGGFSTVYRAYDQQRGQQVAIKQVSLRGLSAEDIIEATHTFHREVSFLSTLRHPQIPQLYEHFSDREHWYLVLQYLEGITLETDLETRTAQGRTFQLDEALDLIVQVCDVLDYLHTQEPPVIFRDLKPSNIMRTAEGKICLIDFGIARFFRPGQARDTQRLGSPGYAAPEQYGRAQTTPQSDIYSLGVLLHALLTGVDPAESALTPLHLEQEIGGSELAACARRMVAPAPLARPASIREVATALEAIQQQRQSQNATRIWHPPTPQPLPMPESELSQVQIQLPTLPGNVVSPPAALPHRMSRRQILLGLGTLTAATAVGSTIWWMNRKSTNVASSGVIGPSLPAITYHGPVYVYRASWASGFVTAVAWSPDSRRIASNAPGGGVQIWDASDGGHPFTYTGQTNVGAVSWSPDGKYIASVDGNEVVQVWEAITGKQVYTHQGQMHFSQGQVSGRAAVTWSPDSKNIVSSDGTMQVWDATSGALLFGDQGQTADVTAVAWSPDGKLIASGHHDGTIQIWDAQTGKQRLTYRGHTANVNAVAWSPVSGSLASASDDATVQVWDSSTGEQRFTYRGHQFGALAVAWSPDGTSIVSGAGDGTAQVWRATDGRRLLTYGGHGDVTVVAWSPDGKRIASGTADGTAQVWNAP